MEVLFVQGDDIDATYDPHQVHSLTAIGLNEWSLAVRVESDARTGSRPETPGQPT